MKEFFECVAGLLIIYLFIKLIQFLIAYPLLGMLVLFMVLGIVIYSAYKRESEKEEERRKKEEQERIEAEAKHAQLIREQEKQRRIIDARQQIEDIAAFQCDILPFIFLLDQEGKANRAFSQLASSCRNIELRIKRDSDQVNREATSLEIQERSKVFFR